MSSIDRDALAESVTEVLIEDQHWHSYVEAGRMVADAILPAVEQAIRAAEQRGREQAAAAILSYARLLPPTLRQVPPGKLLVRADYAARLARGGSTDEEQTP